MAKNLDDFPTAVTAEALASQIGKTVPVRLGSGGPVIGRATVREGGLVHMAFDPLGEPPTGDDPQ